jgi:ubiquitin C-terminal hydrolase
MVKISKFIEKYKGNGYTGLANLGNTCYINSCLQILSHCYELNELLDIVIGNVNNNDEGIFLVEWKKLKDLMWSKNCIISPNRFINIIQQISRKKNRDLFTGFAQNDLPEFLIFIFDCFHDALTRKVEMNISGTSKNETDDLAKECYNMIKKIYSNNYSEMIELFFGIHVSVIQNNEYVNQSLTPEPFNLINLPLPINEKSQTCSIYDCFDLYTIPEYLEGSNAWYNEKTKSKENVYKSIKFWSLPNILIIDFKRFNNQNKKINTVVETPLFGLDLSKYVIGYDKDSYIYELFGICNHSGGCLGGHYTSFIKTANNKWYHFNDTNISEISESNLITARGYCYFYRKLK